MELTPNRGFKNHFRYWLISGTPLQIIPDFATHGMGMWGAYILNEGGPNIKIGSVSGTVGSIGLLLLSGTSHYDYWSGDGWWAVQQNTSSGSVSGYWVSG